jgi:hypothetical protein
VQGADVVEHAGDVAADTVVEALWTSYQLVGSPKPQYLTSDCVAFYVLNVVSGTGERRAQPGCLSVSLLTGCLSSRVEEQTSSSLAFEPVAFEPVEGSPLIDNRG